MVVDLQFCTITGEQSAKHVSDGVEGAEYVEDEGWRVGFGVRVKTDRDEVVGAQEHEVAPDCGQMVCVYVCVCVGVWRVGV